MEMNSVERLKQHGINNIPKNWKVSKVKYIGNYTNGYAFKPENWSSFGKPILRIQDLTKRNSIPNRFKGNLPEKYLIRNNDILISWSASLGIYRWKGEDAWLNQHIFKVNINEEVVSDSFFYWLANWFIQEMQHNMHGSTMQHLTTDAFGGFPVLIPPLNIQKEISQFLTKKLSYIEALIFAKKNIISIFEEKKQALISNAASKGIDSGVALVNTKLPWLEKIPKHWKLIRLKFLAEIKGGIALGKKYKNKTLQEYPYLRVANVQDGNLNLSVIKKISIPKREAELYMLKKGDLLMIEGGDADKLGRGCVWTGEITPCLHQNHVYAVRPISINSAWLNLWTSSTPAKNYFESRAKRTTNLASISLTNVRELLVPVPPENEQKAIINYVNEKIEKIDKLKIATEKSIQLLKERRTALIAAAVTGQLDITD